MGCEIAQQDEWDHDGAVNWDLLKHPQHEGVRQLIIDLNTIYKASAALHTTDNSANGFEWIDCEDADRSVVSFYRYTEDHSSELAIVCNFTPSPHHGYRIGVNHSGEWRELLNTDADVYGGSGLGNDGLLCATNEARHNRPSSISLTLPPLSVLVLEPDTDPKK